MATQLDHIGVAKNNEDYNGNNSNRFGNIWKRVSSTNTTDAY